MFNFLKTKRRRDRSFRNVFFTLILFFSFIFSFNFSFSATTLSSFFSWETFSVKLYCSVNNLLNIDTTKCAEYVPSIVTPVVGEPVNSETSSPITPSIPTPLPTSENTPSYPTQSTTSTIVRTEYLPLIGPQGPMGPMGPRGPQGEKGEKGDTVYVNTTPVSPIYFPVASTPDLSNITGATINSSTINNSIFNDVNIQSGNILANNLTATNSLFTNATTTNLFADNAHFTNFTADNLHITNITTTNSLSNLNNILTSNVGGSVATTTVITQNLLSLTGNILSSVINGVTATSSLVLDYSNILNTPTTLSGYGITDAVPSSRTLTINGTTYDLSANRSWTIPAGTVTSVAMTVPTGLTVTGSPITTSGTLALGLASGYSIPTTAKQTEWDTAYTWGNHATFGYLTSFTETDPIFNAHPVKNISNGTGFLKNNGTGTWSYDNNTYLTTTNASTTYAPILGSENYIQNQTATSQIANFNISGNGLFGGKVGIGINSPSALLDVAGSLRSSVVGAYAEFSASSTATGYPKAVFLVGQGSPVNNTGLIVAPSDSSSGISYPVEFSLNTNKNSGDPTNKLVGMFQGNNYASIHSLGPNGQSAGTPLIFSTQNYYGTHPALFISNSANQNIGIGTSTPNYKLSIQDTANPLQLKGLQSGSTTTDQILSVNGSGVVRQIPTSSLQSNLAFATNEEATTPDFITNWGASLSSFEYPEISLALQGLTQRKVYPRGVYGQTSTQIAVRQGGVSTTATIVGGVIPASAGSVVTVTFPTGYEPVTREGYKVYGTISGVYGVLTYNAGTISFTRSYAGSSVSVASAPLIVDNGNLNSGYIIIWAGMNNYPYTTQVKSDIAAMISHLGHQNYLVLSLINTATTNNVENVAGYNTIIQLNNDLAALYPNNYFDIRTYLVQNGLQDAGITPTSQDLLDISKDVVPTSLRLDAIHLNSAGSKVVAERVNEFLKNSTNNTNKVLLTNNLESIISSSASIGAITIVNNNSLFSTGLIGGGYESDATSSIFLGERAGFQSVNSSNSNFFGQKAGQNTSSANYSNLFGYQSGMSFTGNNIGSNNIIIGTNISLPNATANAMNIGGLLFGTGLQAVTSGNPIITPVAGSKLGIGTSTPGYKLTIQDTIDPLQLVGLQAGIVTDQLLTIDANGIVRRTPSSTYGIGSGTSLQYYAEPATTPSVAPSVASGVTGSIVIGDSAQANAINVNAMGTGAGFGTSANASSSNFFGYGAGYNATNAYHSNYFGSGAGYYATSGFYSNFFGINAGYNASGADSSNFFGRRAGDAATNASNSNFFGYYSGRDATNASYSNFFGYQSGRSFTGNNVGSNNIIIGTNISLPDATANSMNIGGLLFGTGLQSDVTGDPKIIPTSGSKLGIGTSTPGYKLTVVDTANPLQLVGLQTADNTDMLLTINEATGVVRRMYSGSLLTMIDPRYIMNQNSTDQTANFRINGSGYIGNALGVGVIPSYALDVGTSTLTGIVARFTNSTGNCTINPTNTALSCSSDINLKKNIELLDTGKVFTLASVDLGASPNTLKKLAALSPILYNWTVEENGAPKHAGFIAQEVEQIFGDLVSTDGNGMKSVNYMGFVPYIVQGMKEQTLLINGNKDEITTENNFNNFLVKIRNEDQKEVIRTFEERIQNGLNILTDFVSARITAIRGYFEDVFAKNVKTETLKAKVVCVEKNDGTDFCVTGDELENVFSDNVITTTTSNPNGEAIPESAASVEENIASSTEEMIASPENSTSTETIINNIEETEVSSSISETASSTEATQTTTP